MKHSLTPIQSLLADAFADAAQSVMAAHPGAVRPADVTLALTFSAAQQNENARRQRKEGSR